MKKRDGIMTFRLPDEEKAKLVMFSEQADCTISDLAVRAVRDLIAKLEGENPEGKAKRKR
jgi:hypothetical protein